jgi:hypothetical protein
MVEIENALANGIKRKRWVMLIVHNPPLSFMGKS